MNMTIITKEYIELTELLLIVGYVIFSRAKWNHQPWTMGFFCVSGVMLAIDLGVFHCVRPPYVWILLNIHIITAAAIGIYEKILKKSVLYALRKLAVFMFLLVS